MVKINTNFWRFFRRSTAAGLVLLLVLVGWPSAAAAKIKSDWSRVQIVTPGTRTTVLLYKDPVLHHQGKRKIEGQFHSATSEAITLLRDGQTRTLQKHAVHKVLVYRPIAKRYEGWITAGVIGGIIAGAAAKGEDSSEPLPAGVGAALVALVVGVPTVIVFLVAPKMRSVYDVPRRLRDDPVPTPEPAKEDSSTEVSGAKETATDPTGGGLRDRLLKGQVHGPELLSWQARRGLIRKGLPLDSSNLPVLSARTGID